MVIALGIDIGSTGVKASVVRCTSSSSGGDVLEEIAVAHATTASDAAGLVGAALSCAHDALKIAAAGRAQVIGVASMAETGALTGSDGAPRGSLIRWDRTTDRGARERLARRIDARALHAATGVPLAPKTPLLTWADLDIDTAGAHWAFTADLVVAALTGARRTDHTLAGRSGAYLLPPPASSAPQAWDAGLLAMFAIDPGFPPPVLAPGERAGTVRADAVSALGGLVADGAPVYNAGHDHAVAAWIAGPLAVGRRVRSIGTTEAVVAVGDRAVDRGAAWHEGISVVRTVDDAHEAVIAGSPAAGRLIAQWRDRVVAAGEDPERLDADAPVGAPEPVALPYPLGRQCPDPDPSATLRYDGVAAGDHGAELVALLRGIAAHGSWMLAAVDALCGRGDAPVLVGDPYRRNPRLAALSALAAGRPLPLIDLAAPVASGAAALAAVRAGLVARPAAPVRTIEPDRDAPPDLVDRFHAARRRAGGIPDHPSRSAPRPGATTR